MRQETFYQYADVLNVGDEVVLVSERNESTGAESWHAWKAPDGIPGNTDLNIKRFHGWRGTTNNIIREAHGLRRILRMVPVYRKEKGFDAPCFGGCYKITVGPDLHPEWP